MSLRVRLAVLAAAAVAVAVVLVAAIAYRASRDQQLDALDDALVQRANDTADRAALVLDLDTQLRATGRFFAPEGLLQVLDGDDRVLRPDGQEQLPVTAEDLAVARGESPIAIRDVSVDGLPHRLVTVPVRDEGIGPRFGPGRRGSPSADTVLKGDRAIQIAESRVALDDSLAGLRRSLMLVALAGVALAAFVGTVVARRALRPVGRLTDAAEHVAATQDLTASIEVERQDELGRLATAFNAMLSALSRSREQQHQLVTDAGHELRTPLTSLRTNVELLQRADDLPTEERRQIVDAAVEELEELSALVAELVDLATDQHRASDAFEDVDLKATAEQAADRWRRRRTGAIGVTGDTTMVPASPALIERALANLVDNAAKWSDDADPIEVTVAGGRVAVRDVGPGIEPSERSKVFDRFHRSPGSQDVPGSGLGLAIVQQIAEAHGGSVFIEDPEDGPGAVVGFELPT